MGFSWELWLAAEVLGSEVRYWHWTYHSRPPERGAEGLKAPNMVVCWCFWYAVLLLPPMGGFKVWLAGEVATTALGRRSAGEPSLRRSLA